MVHFSDIVHLKLIQVVALGSHYSGHRNENSFRPPIISVRGRGGRQNPSCPKSSYFLNKSSNACRASVGREGAGGGVPAAEGCV